MKLLALIWIFIAMTINALGGDSETALLAVLAGIATAIVSLKEG